jgi:hypothetical protein
MVIQGPCGTIQGYSRVLLWYSRQYKTWLVKNKNAWKSKKVYNSQIHHILIIYHLLHLFNTWFCLPPSWSPPGSSWAASISHVDADVDWMAELKTCGELATPLLTVKPVGVYSTTLVQYLYISCYLSDNKPVLSYLLSRLLPQTCAYSKEYSWDSNKYLLNVGDVDKTTVHFQRVEECTEGS